MDDLHTVCAVLDIEAFQHKSLTFFREIAFAVVDPSLSEAQLLFSECVFSHNVYPPFTPPPEDEAVWRTFDYVKHNVTGLDIHPDINDSLTLPQEAVRWLILGWFEAVASDERYRVAYKGGNLEKRLLEWLRIPSLNLEDYCCPSFESLPSHIRESYPVSCGQHRYCKKGPDHCPIRETSFYRRWLLSVAEGDGGARGKLLEVGGGGGDIEVDQEGQEVREMMMCAIDTRS